MGRSAEAPPPVVERPVEPPPPPSPTSAPAPSGPSVGPGRAFRVPVGHVFVAGAAVILLLVIAFSVGYRRGEASVGDSAEAGLGGSTERPTVREPGSINGTSEPGGETGTDPMSRNSSLGPRTEPNPNQGPQGTEPRTYARDDDSRIQGLNYIIVERFEPDEADRVADFLESKGIDVMVLRDNNPALRMVVTQQGFEGWISNEASQSLLERIKRLGREWKSQHGGKKNFDGAYGKKYRS